MRRAPPRAPERHNATRVQRSQRSMVGKGDVGAVQASLNMITTLRQKDLAYEHILIEDDPLKRQAGRPWIGFAIIIVTVA